MAMDCRPGSCCLPFCLPAQFISLFNVFTAQEKIHDAACKSKLKCEKKVKDVEKEIVKAQKKGDPTVISALETKVGRTRGVSSPSSSLPGGTFNCRQEIVFVIRLSTMLCLRW